CQSGWAAAGSPPLRAASQWETEPGDDMGSSPGWGRGPAEPGAIVPSRRGPPLFFPRLAPFRPQRGCTRWGGAPWEGRGQPTRGGGGPAGSGGAVPAGGGGRGGPGLPFGNGGGARTPARTRVGPRATCEQWKSTPGHRQWLKAAGQGTNWHRDRPNDGRA